MRAHAAALVVAVASRGLTWLHGALAGLAVALLAGVIERRARGAPRRDRARAAAVVALLAPLVAGAALLQADAVWFLLRNGRPPALPELNQYAFWAAQAVVFDAQVLSGWAGAAAAVGAAIHARLRSPGPGSVLETAGVLLVLQALLDALYERAGYDLDVDYTRPPVPPLGGEDAEWAVNRVRERAT